MPIIVAIIDEFHEMSESASLEHRRDFDTMVDVARQARAVGIILILATQRPDSEAISTRLRDMLTYRLGLRCLSRDNSNMVLGDGMAANGYDCTLLSPAQQGTGWLRADKGEPQLVRWAAVTPAESLREVEDSMAHHGLVPVGHGAGDVDPTGSDPDTDDRSIIEYVADVLLAGEEIISTEDIADRLSTQWPAVFGGWTKTKVGRELGTNSPYGLRTQDRRPHGRLVKTLTRNEIMAAAGRQLEETAR